MFTGKEGFILIDALICCLIMVTLAGLVSAYTKSHADIHEMIWNQKEEMEKEWEIFYENMPQCDCSGITEDSY